MIDEDDHPLIQCVECKAPKPRPDGTVAWAHGWVAYYKDNRLVGEICHLCQVDKKIKDLSERLLALEQTAVTFHPHV